MAIFYGTLPFFLCYIFLIFSPVGSSLSDSEALIRLRKGFTNSKAIDSWGNNEKPCAINIAKWPGIFCENGLVTNVHLEDMGLSGKIDVDALLEMKGLRVVSFEGNSFSGLIPELNRLGALKAIYLSRNKFSGEIPLDFFDGMGSLKRVWLDKNNFMGKIPSSFANLSDLTELHLENNQFSGPIPPLDIQTLDSFNLSNNNLEGEIPSTLSRFDAKSFEGNPGLCGEKIGKICQENDSKPSPTEKKSSSIAAALMVTAVMILMIVIVAIFLLRRQQKKFSILEKESLDGSVEGGSSSLGGSRTGSNRRGLGSSKKGSMMQPGSGRTGDLELVNDDKGTFGLADLMKAGAEVLGNGTLGSSYKATMSNGIMVVVKRIKGMNRLGRDGFDTEIRRLARLRHPNVLVPLAYHHRKEEKLLVSEYALRGNLLYLLHGDRGPNHAELNWPTRLKIVGGITRGLYYLHTELSSIGLPHGNLKSSNVLLVPGFEPLLVDYGFSQLLNPQQATQALHAYKTPEAESSNQVSPKSDIYCFGIIILEILTGKFHNNYMNTRKGGIDVVEWVRSAVSDGRESEVLDPEVLDDASAEEMERLLHVGVACVEKSPDERPDIREVLGRVEEIERACVRTHGYGGLPVQGSHLSHVQSGSYGSLSGRRLESFGARSERRNSDNLAFDMS